MVYVMFNAFPFETSLQLHNSSSILTSSFQFGTVKPSHLLFGLAWIIFLADVRMITYLPMQ